MFAAGDSGLQRAANVEPADVRASPQLDPRLAACVVTVWCSGLLISLPTYSPFPRLLLPFLAVIWIAAAAGIGWWVEACISVARRSAKGSLEPVAFSSMEKNPTKLSILSAKETQTLAGFDGQSSLGPSGE